MSDIVLQKDKDCSVKGGIINSRRTIATVTTCLGPHCKCTGIYEDSLTGHYLIRCCCPCGHPEYQTERTYKKQKTERQVESNCDEEIDG